MLKEEELNFPSIQESFVLPMLHHMELANRVDQSGIVQVPDILTVNSGNSDDEKK